MGFAQPYLDVRSSDGRNFILLADNTFTAESGEVIELPKGAGSDGASTPPFIWAIIPPFGLYWMAAYLHDYLYRYTQQAKDFCDRMFLEAMKALGVPELERLTMYEAVKEAGESAFSADRKAQAAT